MCYVVGGGGGLLLHGLVLLLVSLAGLLGVRVHLALRHRDQTAAVCGLLALWSACSLLVFRLRVVAMLGFGSLLSCKITSCILVAMNPSPF